MSVFIFRLVVIALITLAGYFFSPFRLAPYIGAIIGFVLSIVIVYLETRIRKTQFRVIWSSTIGTFAGVLLGWGLGSIYQRLQKIIRRLLLSGYFFSSSCLTSDF